MNPGSGECLADGLMYFLCRPWIKDRFMAPDIEAAHRLLLEQKASWSLGLFLSFGSLWESKVGVGSEEILSYSFVSRLCLGCEQKGTRATSCATLKSCLITA